MRSFVIGSAGLLTPFDGRGEGYRKGPPVNIDRDAACDRLEATVPLERRTRVRYPVNACICYRGLDRGPCAYQTGLATNLSSHGILIITDDSHDVQQGATLEIKIEWACQLGGTIPLNLVAIGRVVRCEPYRFAAILERHEFRIGGKASQRSMCNALKMSARSK